jgi:maltose alpha-D-glucosyltransferase/alpha-amylase
MAATTSVLVNDPLWYKDAVIYELHIKAFRDSSDDGIGDIQGIISKLDYLQNLGITALWLLPFYPSPLRDDGYDIARYTEINAMYGTLGDFKELLRQAHRRGIRIITELVLNHTSDQHPWFQKSRQARPGSKWRDFYVWSDTPDKYPDARVIFKDFEESNWSWDPVAKAYYFHRFYSHQPDLNYDNPKVHKAMLDVIDFWFDLGVDGMRLDAVPYLYEREDTNCENLPETHAFLRKLRAHIDKRYSNRMLLAEANQWSEDAVAYFGDGDSCHMAFNFPIMPRMFMALQMEERYPIIEILDPPLEIPETAQWALFLRNHDELTLEMVTDEERDYMYRMYATDPKAKINVGIRRRLAPLLGNNRRRIELMNILLLSLPGTPVIYYGDEIGMGDNFYLGDRDGVRTPMQWTPDRNAGFSRSNPQKLYLPVIIDPEYHYEAVNVETQDNNPSSLLWWMRRVIAMRKNFKVFGRGTCEFVSGQNHRVLAFLRTFEDETVLVVVNLSRFSQCVELDLSGYVDYVPSEMFSQNDFPRIKNEPYMVTLGPHGHYWFVLKPAEDVAEVTEERPLPSLQLSELPTSVLTPQLQDWLERRVLIPYMRRSRWFGGKGRRIRSVRIVETAPVSNSDRPRFFLLLRVTYNEGLPDRYLLPLSIAFREAAAMVKKNCPSAALGDVRVGENEGVAFDGSHDPELHQVLFDLIARHRHLKAKDGDFRAFRVRGFKASIQNRELPLDSRLLGAEQSNTSVAYDEAFILKLYRRLEMGVNPDAEIGRALSEKARFEHTPSFRGAIEYRSKNGTEPIVVGLLQDFIPNQGDAWSYLTDHLWRFFEHVLSRRNELETPSTNHPIRMDMTLAGEYPVLMDLVGEFQSEMISLLGERTGQLHLALASLSKEPAFAAEPFSQLYQRSVYQTMRNLVRRVIDSLQKSYGKFTPADREDAQTVIENQAAILETMRRILQKKFSAMKIRIHGDYHLGQVLFTGKDFFIIDFEGEPARALSERRLKRSPLRDVAGMIRSFHYAVHTGLLRHPSIRVDDRPVLIPWAEAWYRYAGSLFLDTYMRTVEDAPFLPRRREDANILFESFLLEKAVYELGYELNNRPDWVSIPLRGILDLLQQADQS